MRRQHIFEPATTIAGALTNYHAAIFDQAHLVPSLLAAKANPNEVYKCWASQQVKPVLHAAALSVQRVNIVEQLLQAKACVNETDSIGTTVIQRVTRETNVDCVAALIDAKADLTRFRIEHLVEIANPVVQLLVKAKAHVAREPYEKQFPYQRYYAVMGLKR
jgi:hypothetical protein